MTVTIIHVAERKCPTCPRMVKHETLRSDVAGTGIVTVARCPACDKR